MSVQRSPVKLAPIFTHNAQNNKRKNPDEVEKSEEEVRLDGFLQTEAKRVCSDDDRINGEVSNETILRAITSLAERIDGMESKLIATVDSKLQEFEAKFSTKTAEMEGKLDSRLCQMHDEIYENLDRLESVMHGRINEALSTLQIRAQETTESRIDKLERMSLANELTISGVPQTQNENLDAICSKICTAIGFNGTNTIQSCFRVAPKSRNASRSFPPSIIVKFWSSDAKVGFFKSYIVKKNLCVTSIGFNTPSRIYINENFTKKNFEVLRRVRHLKTNGKIFQYRTVSGRVYVVLDPDSEQIGINSIEQLDHLVGDTAAQQDKSKNSQRKRSSNKQASKAKQSGQAQQQIQHQSSQKTLNHPHDSQQHQRKSSPRKP